MPIRTFRQLRMLRLRAETRRSARARRLDMGLEAVAGGAESETEPGSIDPELSRRESVVLMLHTAAEIEHSLMVQYLFAAYSIQSGIAVPGTAGVTTSTWRQRIIQTAKEEMGHLLTVQNALRLVGGPLHFDRDNFPYRSRFYPYAFELVPFSKRSLSKYIAAEMPDESLIPATELSAAQLTQIKHDSGGAVNRVGLLFEALLRSIDTLEGSDLRPDHLAWQADGGQWKADFRNFGGPDHSLPASSAAGVVGLPFIDSQQLHTGLDFVANQGESPLQASESSHFERFARIYREWDAALQADPTFQPAFPIVDNPNTTSPPDPGDVLTREEQAQEQTAAAGRINDPKTLLWAQLFNLRYRVLLTEIQHYFLLGPLLPPSGTDPAGPIRDQLVVWAFQEMLLGVGSIKALSKLLVQFPAGNQGKSAGPTFELPYSLDLPDLRPEQWRVHLDLIKASQNIIGKIEADFSPSQDELDILHGIADRDTTHANYINQVKDM